MNTHNNDNIGFNEEMTKIIFQLSSNIIKETLYLFFWALVDKICFSNSYICITVLSNLLRPTLKLFLFPHIRPCFSGMGQSENYYFNFSNSIPIKPNCK